MTAVKVFLVWVVAVVVLLLLAAITGSAIGSGELFLVVGVAAVVAALWAFRQRRTPPPAA
jgi:4-hydroxybenzoate polyprenyltransferase